jgi:small subunit ribosomal protein S6
MPLYELGVILDPEVGPEEETAALERLEKIIVDADGKVVDRDAWGRRQLAYQIKRKTHGVYHFWKFEVDGQVLTNLNFELRTNDTVMRSLVLNLDTELRRHRKGERKLQLKAAKKAAKAAAAAEAAGEAS